ncbi:MAG: 4Fe-4S dicluster domain-containing protein [bacterium]|nr:4Fe-4S dicluster domain-containing protein [bacterium]
MELFTIDANKCNKDGICVKTCPLHIIEMKGENELPTPIKQAGELCVRCGHCVAVCPHGALSHEAMSPEDCETIQKDLLPSAEQAALFLKSRRSIRVYKDKPVEKDTLTNIITTASYAPSGHNTQPVEWKVIYEKDKLNSLSSLVADWMRHMIKEQPAFAEMLHLDLVVEGWENGFDGITRGAPHMVVAHADKNNPMAPAASTIALSYLELAAFSSGLGACWAGYVHIAALQWPPMQEALALPENHVFQGAVLVGHPQFRYKRLPVRKEPKITW